MESVTKCLAANIRRLRKNRAWTQTQLAKRAGISLIFLQGLESERKWLSPETAKSVARALGISESKLFENCFEKSNGRKKRRPSRPRFDHVPDDIFVALVTTCREPSWTWETFRWILQGWERDSEGRTTMKSAFG